MLACTWTTTRCTPVADVCVRARQLNDTLSLGQHRVWKRMAVKWAGAAPGQAVLDVCCGSGDLAFRLAEAVGPTGKVRPAALRALAALGAAHMQVAA